MNNQITLLALSGKMGSGKDTVALIIRYLLWESDREKTDRFRFLTDLEISQELSGKMLVKHMDAYCPWKIKRFAENVKKIASLLTGIPIEKFEDQDFKKTLLPAQWNERRIMTSHEAEVWRMYDGNMDEAVLQGWAKIENQPHNFWRREVNKPMQVRELLQKIGTDAMRDQVHQNVWVNSVFADYVPRTSPNSNHPDDTQSVGCDVMTEWYPQWLITDMRFKNELAAVERYGGKTIRIHRPGHADTGSHPSETDLDESSFDYTIVNDGTLEYLVGGVRAVLTDMKLL